MESVTLAKQLWALGDEVRLRLLALLPYSPEVEEVFNVSRLAEKLGLAQPTVSHHLRVLRQAGVVQHRKVCRDVIYWIDRTAIEELLSAQAKLLLEAAPQPSAAATSGSSVLTTPGHSEAAPPTVSAR